MTRNAQSKVVKNIALADAVAVLSASYQDGK